MLINTYMAILIEMVQPSKIGNKCNTIFSSSIVSVMEGKEWFVRMKNSTKVMI
jgi:hypothetical protein